MFSSSATSSNFKGLRRKATNDGSMSTLHMSRPSTATSTEHHYGHGITDRFGPALEGPPSPEGIRAFSRRMKRGSSIGHHNETRTSSGSSSFSETPELSRDRLLESPGLSRNPSQRSSVMPFKDRPESVQLFGKAVFSRKPKLRKEHSDQGIPNSSLLSLTHMVRDSAVDQPKDHRSIQSMFTRRRPRGASAASQKRYQISGPYDFQHVSHSAKESLSSLDQINHGDLSPGVAGMHLPAMADAVNSSTGLTLQDLDKPLPTPPSTQDLERSSSEESVQFSPRRPPRAHEGSPRSPRSPRSLRSPMSPMSPIPPPPRTSSRMSTRNDSIDSFKASTFDRLGTNSGHRPVQPFILPSADGLRSPPNFNTINVAGEEDLMSGDEGFSRTALTNDIPAWPLTGSMTSLPEVPEEEEYHLTTTHSRTSIMSSTISLRGSVSVPHLRRISLTQTTQRPPSNASDTLGRFDLLAAQRALHESDHDDTDDEPSYRHSWEDDIDYCYDHAAEADCDFAWERSSCDMERGDEDYAESLILGLGVQSSASSFGGLSTGLLSVDLPGLSPTSYQSRSTHEAITPTSATMPVTANFSLPRIDSSAKLKRDHDRSHSSSSSFQESQGFCLSPSLLIPDDYHEQMLRYERGELSSHNSTDDLQVAQQDDQYLKFDKPDTRLPARCSASTTVSTLSEQSATSSRYASSTFSSSAFTRWTGSSSSSWQHIEPSQQPVAITLNDKEPMVTPTGEVPVMRPSETAVVPPPQETSRDGHSRAQSEATLLLTTPHDKVTPLEPKAAMESLKTHRRARTASRSHTTSSPQFALFPQIPPRI
jgi:hypothetical protein